MTFRGLFLRNTINTKVAIWLTFISSNVLSLVDSENGHLNDRKDQTVESRKSTSSIIATNLLFEPHSTRHRDGYGGR